MKSRSIKLKNDIDINLKYFLQKDRQTLLLLHFGSGNLHIWNGVVPYLSEEYNIIMPDLRGHGKSSKPKNGYHIKDLAQDMIYLLDELEVDQFHIIGSSLGAEVGIVIASQLPDRVNSIVCEGAFHNEFGQYGLKDIPQEEIDKKIEEEINYIENRKEESYQTKEEYIETQKRFFQRSGFWNKYFEEYIENDVCQNEKGRYCSCYPLYVSKEYLKNYYNFEFEKYYKNIKCPILFLPGTLEWRNEKIKKIVSKFGNLAGDYKIGVIKGFIHAYGWMKVPDRAAKTVLSFLKNIK